MWLGPTVVRHENGSGQPGGRRYGKVGISHVSVTDRYPFISRCGAATATVTPFRLGRLPLGCGVTYTSIMFAETLVLEAPLTSFEYATMKWVDW